MRIKIESANRPENDSIESWRENISNALKDRRRIDGYRDLNFVECDACASSPGSPTLCAGCLANRETISRLRDVAKIRT